jgi:membrane protein involved in colicin uptake
VTNPLDRIPRLHPALFALVLVAILFGILILKDLFVSNEALKDVWQGDLTTAVVVSAFYSLFANRIRQNSATKDGERDQ